MASQRREPSEGRNGSGTSEAGSWSSKDTVRDNQSTQRSNSDQSMSRGRNTPGQQMKMDSSNPSGRGRPGVGVPPEFYTSMFSSDNSTDYRKPPTFGSHQKALAVLGTDDPGPPPSMGSSSSRQNSSHSNHQADYFNQESVSPWSSSPQIGPTDASGTFYNDSEHESSPVSATFRPSTGRTYASEPFELDYSRDRRRPSAASATTISSQGSKSSGGRFRKKLQGFFGDEFLGSSDQKPESDHGSLHSSKNPGRLGPIDQAKARERANSDGSRTFAERPDGPSPQPPPRPSTPMASSEITPWDYQNLNDVSQYGRAPVRDTPIVRGRGPPPPPPTSQRDQTRKPNHRHSQSKEEKPTIAGDLAGYPSRPTTGQDDSSIGLRPFADGGVGGMGSASAMASSTTLAGRPTSPTPSLQSSYSREQGQNSPGATGGGKRSLLGKIRFPKGHGPLKHLPGASKTTQDQSKNSKRRDPSPRRARQGSLEGPADAKDGKQSKLRGRHGGREAVAEEPGVWALDTDLNHMEGILANSQAARGRGDSTTALPEEGKNQDAGNWDAPESWQVKRQGEDLATRLPKIANEAARTGPEGDGSSYFLRVFRIDSTFATLSTGLNATVADILLMLGRKSFLQDHLNNYEIVMRKHDLSRQLDHTEQPIRMQKRLLEQVGYTERDRIEDIGREDHSYICRFVFLPTKLSGYSSLEGDPGFNKMQKFSHVDLQGRSLVTIPITLYKKASEIISLNLSRNLSLDVPRDFIQGCVNLREIKFISNEALRLPTSFSLASRLTYLDVSNNLLEDLDHAGLDRLHGLVSIKLANNKLTTLPSYFGKFPSLRSLNISSNSFQAFPEFLCDLKSLVNLDISFNNISDLPNIGRLRTLERVWMTNNMMSGPLDESFKNLENLREIDARFNGINNIDNISLLPRLEQLFIGHNAISRFRGSFPKLRSLFLDHCPMYSR